MASAVGGEIWPAVWIVEHVWIVSGWVAAMLNDPAVQLIGAFTASVRRYLFPKIFQAIFEFTGNVLSP